MSTSVVAFKRPAAVQISRRSIALLVLLLLSLVSLAGTTKAYADTSSEIAHKNLTIEVYNRVSNNSYETDGGGSIRGSQILQKESDGAYGINKSEYSKLNGKGREALAGDMWEASNKAVDNGKKTGVTTETQENWFKELQKNPGFGTKLMNSVLSQVGPDFVTANKVFKPFAGPLSTLIGFFAVVLFALFTLSIVVDIMYIVLPFMSFANGDRNNGTGGGKSSLVSSAAVSAKEESANSGGGNGKHKNGLWLYFKYQAVVMLVLGICLVYLIQGQFYVLVGMFLDLLNGMLF